MFPSSSIRMLVDLVYRRTQTTPLTVFGGYRPDIDGLRSIAIIAVVAYHILSVSVVSGGFVGVDIFFVISGYLISGILLSSVGGGRFSFREFYYRRIRRIFPSAILVMTTCLVAGWFLLLGGEYRFLGWHTAGGAAFASNFVMWNEAGYFDGPASQKILLHFWSLGIEEQFYIVLPVVMLLAWRLRLRFSAVFLSLFLLSFLFCLMTVAHDQQAAFYSPLTRGWELMAGCLLSLFVRNTSTKGCGAPMSRWGRLLLRGAWMAEGPLAVGLILWPVLDYYHKTLFPGWTALPPVLAACLLIHAGTRLREGMGWRESFWQGTLVNRLLLCNRPMVWIGLISYPLYLWHWPIWYFTKLVFPEAGWMVQIGAILASVCLAAATYFLLERPIRTKYANTQTVVVCCCLMAIVGAFGYWIHRNNGYPNRCPAEYSSLWHTLDIGYADAFTGWVRQPNALLQPVPGKPTVMLVSDSHGLALIPPLGEGLRAKGEILLARMGAYGVPLPGLVCLSPVPGKVTAINQAQATINEMYRIIDSPEGENIKTVVLLCVWGLNLFRSDPLFAEAGAGTVLHQDYTAQMQQEAICRSLRSTLASLTQKNIRVIFCIDTPAAQDAILGSIYPRAYLPRPLLGSSYPPYIARVNQDRNVRQYMQVLQPVLAEFPQVQVYDPNPLFCDEANIYFIRNGKLLFIDDNHLSIEGGKMVAEDLIQRYFSARATAKVERENK